MPCIRTYVSAYICRYLSSSLAVNSIRGGPRFRYSSNSQSRNGSFDTALDRSRIGSSLTRGLSFSSNVSSYMLTSFPSVILVSAPPLDGSHGSSLQITSYPTYREKLLRNKKAPIGIAQLAFPHQSS